MFIIIALAMVMINGVLVVFWQEHIIKRHLKTVETHLRVEALNIIDLASSNNSLSLLELQNIVGADQYNITKIIVQNYLIQFNNRGEPTIELLSNIPSPDTIKNLLEGSTVHKPSLFRKNRHFIIEVNSSENSNHLTLGITTDVSSFAEQIWAKEKVIFLYIVFNAAVLTTILFFRFRKTLFMPIDNLLNMANNYQLHEGLWSIQTSHGEFDQLSQAMKGMVQRIEADRDTLIHNVKQLEIANSELQKAQQEMLQAEKLAATGRLAAGFAHEIGNPVSIIQGYLELLQQNEFSDAEKEEFLERSKTELQRIDKLLFDLMDLAKERPQHITKVSIADVLKELISTLKPTYEKQSITFDTNGVDHTHFLHTDPERIRQVFLNIFLNAIDAILEKKDDYCGTIHCSTKILDSSGNNNSLKVTITDDGTGFDHGLIKRIFDPFFTTKPVGRGTGLGLSVVHRIVEDLGGTIEVTSKVDHGTTFYIYLPIYVKGQQ